MKTIMNYTKIGSLPLLFLILLFVSCDDFVTVDLPNSQLTAPVVFEDMATANAAMTSIYSKIRDNGLLTGSPSGLSHQLGNYTDELDYYGDPLNLSFDFYNNSLSASNTHMKGLWLATFNQIYAANAVYYSAEHSTTLSLADKNQLKGEALFVRGLLHFYLANLYGDVPYIATTDYTQNINVSRLPITTVYTNIKNDLTNAVDLLSESYITSNRTRPNRLTVRALLARLNLYSGMWAEASNDASAVINATDLYVWETNLDLIFLKDSPTTIWQLSPALGVNNTEEGSTFIFTSGPPPMSALTTDLVAAFSVGDLRRTHWIGEVTDGTTTWHYSNKYKLPLTGAGSQEYSIVFRLAEQYLIRAEARAQQGDLIGAKEDLNKVRNRAGLGDTTAMTVADLLSAILDERRLELFTEHGHRFFDLKRTNQLNTVLGAVKSGWNTTDVLLPLPVSELLLNPNLAPQNPGY
jgi:hypothetical protein